MPKQSSAYLTDAPDGESFILWIEHVNGDTVNAGTYGSGAEALLAAMNRGVPSLNVDLRVRDTK